MIELLEFKELLGEESDNLTDIEIKRIRDLEYQIADALFENWLSQRTITPKNELANSV
jgi:hypothetical protein